MSNHKISTWHTVYSLRHLNLALPSRLPLALRLRDLPVALHLFIRHHALHHRHKLLPACELGISSQILATGHILHREGDSDVPHDEGEVRVCTFEADEPPCLSR